MTRAIPYSWRTLWIDGVPVELHQLQPIQGKEEEAVLPGRIGQYGRAVAVFDMPRDVFTRETCEVRVRFTALRPTTKGILPGYFETGRFSSHKAPHYRWELDEVIESGLLSAYPTPIYKAYDSMVPGLRSKPSFTELYLLSGKVEEVGSVEAVFTVARDNAPRPIFQGDNAVYSYFDVATARDSVVSPDRIAMSLDIVLTTQEEIDFYRPFYESTDGPSPYLWFLSGDSRHTLNFSELAMVRFTTPAPVEQADGSLLWRITLTLDNPPRIPISFPINMAPRLPVHVPELGSYHMIDEVIYPPNG